MVGAMAMVIFTWVIEVTRRTRLVRGVAIEPAVNGSDDQATQSA
jgi:hypothetical protein